MTLTGNLLTTHQRIIESCSLYNILPRGMARAWEPQNLLWKGTLVLDELILVCDDGEMDRMPRYRFKFLTDKEEGVDKEAGDDTKRLFCETEVIASLQDLYRVIQKKGSWFQIAMLCEGQKRYQIALELRIKDSYHAQQFKDIILRITDEYEIFQSVYAYDSEY